MASRPGGTAPLPARERPGWPRRPSRGEPARPPARRTLRRRHQCRRGRTSRCRRRGACRARARRAGRRARSNAVGRPRASSGAGGVGAPGAGGRGRRTATARRPGAPRNGALTTPPTPGNPGQATGLPARSGALSRRLERTSHLQDRGAALRSGRPAERSRLGVAATTRPVSRRTRRKTAPPFLGSAPQGPGEAGARREAGTAPRRGSSSSPPGSAARRSR